MAYFYMLKRLWLYAAEERWKVAVYYLLHAVSVLGDLGKPYAFAMIVNALQADRPTLLSDVSRGLAVYAFCVLAFEVMHRPARYVEIGVAFRCRRRFIDAMYDRLQSLPLSWHAEHHSGNMIDRINVAARALNDFGVAQMNYVAVSMKVWGPLLILWKMSPPISVASFVVGVLMVAISRALYRRIVPLYRGMLEILHDFAAAFYDTMSNVKTVVTLRLGPHVKRDLEERLARAYPYLMRENNVTQVKCLSVALLTLLLETGVIFYYVAARLHAGEAIMIGSVTAIFQYLGQLMEGFQFYAGDYEEVIHWRADFEAIRPVLDARPRISAANLPALGDWERLAIGPIGFSYGDGAFQLRDVSLRLERASKIALVGESGSGKSALLQALRGLIEIPDARLSADDGEMLPLAALSETTTLIPQEPEIFENTLRYNVTMGVPATDEEIRAAIRIAGFDPVVEMMPKKLESDIREKGVNLSGGEKQRLALARGALAIRDSRIVLLDEPTSSVDPGIERMIFARLFESLAERCVIASIHRLHLARLFDRIYVMKEGRIVEEGTFDELRERDGEFARLWSMYQAEDECAEAS